jgi:hypothetical protein
MKTETYTKTIERKYTKVNETEVRTATLIDFLNELEDSERMHPVKWCHEFDNAAKPLLNANVINRTNRGNWYANDRDTINEMKNELFDEL